MADCYITQTGVFLPGDPVDNADIHHFLGRVIGETAVKQKILKLNGIQSRHYALDRRQKETHTVYEQGAEAVRNCLQGADAAVPVDYLAAGTTHAPILAPGLASLLHDQLNRQEIVRDAVEINSNSGICTSGAQAFVNAARAVKAGDAQAALCVGVDQPSMALKSRAFRPTYDVKTMWRNLNSSKWFMSVFLRFMLSDGAGAFLMQQKPAGQGPSLRVNWTYSRSYANEAPLCMKLERSPLVLSQNVSILSRYMPKYSRRVLVDALDRHGESIDDYAMLLPHMSSYFFEPSVKKTVAKLSKNGGVPYWTNLRTAGNTGAASAYIMLDGYLRTGQLVEGDRILLFVPESGQFNYVLMSLTVVL